MCVCVVLDCDIKYIFTVKYCEWSLNLTCFTRVHYFKLLDCFVVHVVGTSGHSKNGYNSLILIILNTCSAFEKGLS